MTSRPTECFLEVDYIGAVRVIIYFCSWSSGRIS